MPKKIKGMLIEIQLAKGADGKVEVEATAQVHIGTTEYPDMNLSKVVPITNTPSETTAIINYAKKKLADIMAAEDAQDGIPTPEP